MSRSFSKGVALEQLKPITVISESATSDENATLCVETWLEYLSQMDAAVREWRPKVQEAPDAVILLLQQYHHLHVEAARRVALPLSVWHRWRRGVETLWQASDRAPHASSSAPAVTSAQQRTLLEHENLFAIHCWGCSGTVAPRLKRLVERWEDRLRTLGSSVLTVQSVSEMEKLLSAELHTFSRLAKDASHLFLEYPIIGKTERELLEGVQTSDDAVLEAAVRSSFRRDVRVASAAVETKELMDEYKLFEVDDKKEDDVAKVLIETACSSQHQALWTLYQHMSQLKSGPDEKSISGSGHYPLLDDEGNRLADNVVQEWKKSAEKCFCAFAFTMQRLIELESFPGVLNSSRLCFMLHLLHTWWSQYSRQQHRWHIRSVFAAEDDSDVWAFLTERHEVLLRWAMIAPSGDARDGLSSKVEAIRTVTQSVVHCLYTLLAHLETGRMAPPKAALRRSTAITACVTWLEKFVVGVVAPALMNDVYTYAEVQTRKEDGGSGPEEWIVLPREAQLKIALLDAFAPLGRLSGEAYEANYSRLTAITDDLLDELERWKSAAVPSPEAPTVLWEWALRLLQRGVGCLPGHVQPGQLATATGHFVQVLTLNFRRLQVLAAELLMDERKVEAAADAWRLFALSTVSHHGPLAVEGPPPPPLILAYDPVLNAGQNRNGELKRLGSSVMDIVMERRKQLKRARHADVS